MGPRAPTGPASHLCPSRAMQRVARRRATSEEPLRWLPSGDLGSSPVRAPVPGTDARSVWNVRASRREISRPANLSTEIGRARPASRSGNTLEPEARRASHPSELGRGRPECTVVESRAPETAWSARGGASRPPPWKDGRDPAIARGAGDPRAPGRADDWFLARFRMAGRVDRSRRAHRPRGCSAPRVRELGAWPRRAVESIRSSPERPGTTLLGGTTTNASLPPPDRGCAGEARAASARPRRNRSTHGVRHRLQLLSRLSPGDRLLTGRVLAPSASATLSPTGDNPPRDEVSPESLQLPGRFQLSRVPNEPADSRPKPSPRGSALSVRGCGR